MSEAFFDVAVIGSGFGGSLCALILSRCGMHTALIERGSHPRFALGESSTPMADLILRDLARQYDLPALLPLTQYGTWRRTYPNVMCGLKRGFSYFHHEAGRVFQPRADHANELLVAANPSDEEGDTHWLRADVDQFFMQQAVAAGAAFFDRTRLTHIEQGPPWRIDGERPDGLVRVHADFVIDASGYGGALSAALSASDNTKREALASNTRREALASENWSAAPHILSQPLTIESRSDRLSTNSWSLYSHFCGVKPWQTIYESRGGRSGEHPFACDAAALHHVFDGGWMWVLRFDNGMTSAGFCLEPSAFAPTANQKDAAVAPATQWRQLLERFPSVAEQFADAQPLFPIVRTGRLQRLSAPCAGPDWAMLPSTAGIIDALHSTGNAHTLSGVERLIPILLETQPGTDRAARLTDYSRAITREIDLIDRLVDGCYRGFARFEPMVAYAMLYFAAATFTEHHRAVRPPSADLRVTRPPPADPGVARPPSAGSTAQDQPGFLLSDDPAFRAVVAQAHAAMRSAGGAAPNPPADPTSCLERMREAIAPWNIAGLCDPGKRNMYPFM